MAKVIGGVSFTDFGTDALRTNGRYWGQLDPGFPSYEIVPISAPGMDGTSQMKYGFRSQDINLTLYYVAASYNACLALYETDTAAWANASLTVDGKTNCYLGSTAIIRPPKKDVTTYWMHVAARFVKRA